MGNIGLSENIDPALLFSTTNSNIKENKDVFKTEIITDLESTKISSKLEKYAQIFKEKENEASRKKYPTTESIKDYDSIIFNPKNRDVNPIELKKEYYKNNNLKTTNDNIYANNKDNNNDNNISERIKVLQKIAKNKESDLKEFKDIKYEFEKNDKEEMILRNTIAPIFAQAENKLHKAIELMNKRISQLKINSYGTLESAEGEEKRKQIYKIGKEEIISSKLNLLEVKLLINEYEDIFSEDTKENIKKDNKQIKIMSMWFIGLLLIANLQLNSIFILKKESNITYNHLKADKDLRRNLSKDISLKGKYSNFRMSMKDIGFTGIIKQGIRSMFKINKRTIKFYSFSFAILVFYYYTRCFRYDHMIEYLIDYRNDIKSMIEMTPESVKFSEKYFDYNKSYEENYNRYTQIKQNNNDIKNSVDTNKKI